MRLQFANKHHKHAFYVSDGKGGSFPVIDLVVPIAELMKFARSGGVKERVVSKQTITAGYFADGKAATYPIKDTSVASIENAVFGNEDADKLPSLEVAAVAGVSGSAATFYVVSDDATAIGTEVCLSGTTAGGKLTTPVRFSERSKAEEIAAFLGDSWYVSEHPWPSHPGIGPAVFNEGGKHETDVVVI